MHIFAGGTVSIVKAECKGCVIKIYFIIMCNSLSSKPATLYNTHVVRRWIQGDRCLGADCS